MNRLDRGVEELSKKLERLAVENQEVDAATAKRNRTRGQVNTMLDAYRGERVLVISSNWSSPHKDEHGVNDTGGHYILYKGQLERKKYDGTIVDPDLRKELFLKTPSKEVQQNMPEALVRRVGDKKYFHAGRITRIVQVKARGASRDQPEYKIYFNVDVDFDPSRLVIHPDLLAPYAKALHASNKASVIIAHGFIPLKLSAGEGPIMCTSIKSK